MDNLHPKLLISKQAIVNLGEECLPNFSHLPLTFSLSLSPVSPPSASNPFPSLCKPNGNHRAAAATVHLNPRDRSRSTRREDPIKTHPISLPESRRIVDGIDWFEPEVSDRCAAASAVCFR
ncbi:unnamed protein product [Prunus armeniaca]